jgi:hypothetical protein
MTKKEPQMTPFSNGTEAMSWYYHNCEQCVKAYFPKEPGNWPKDSTIRQYISCGKECKMKYHIDYGFITGEIPVSIAEQIGYTEEKGFPSSCIMFSDKDDDRYRPPKRPSPDDTPPNQMVMPFYLEEIGVKALTVETVEQ